MRETITKAELREWRREFQALAAREKKQAVIKSREAKLHEASSAVYSASIDEIDLWLNRRARPRTSLRYRNPGATTDIVKLIYDTPGIEFDQLALTVHDHYSNQGTTMDTVNKMIRRLVREEYARRDGSKLFLTDICRAAWETSPLYPAS